jgi:hypothetical protein
MSGALRYVRRLQQLPDQEKLGLDSFFIKPEGKATAIAESFVILRPVRDASISKILDNYLGKKLTRVAFQLGSLIDID